MNYALDYLHKEVNLSIFMNFNFCSYMQFFMMLLKESVTNMEIIVFLVFYRDCYVVCYKKGFCMSVTLLNSNFLCNMSYLKELSDRRIFF